MFYRVVIIIKKEQISLDNVIVPQSTISAKYAIIYDDTYIPKFRRLINWLLAKKRQKPPSKLIAYIELDENQNTLDQ